MRESSKTIKIDTFKPRSYQLPIIKAFEVDKYRRILAILPRRAGKDITAFNIMFREALRTVGVYYYILPTYSQAKRVIWDSITNDGVQFLDYIPDDVISSKNSQEMKIKLCNGSLIQLVGSDTYDNLMGTNPRGCVFSEYSLQDPRAYQYIRPILSANNGWAIFLSTPRGKNHLWDLYNIAQQSDQWFCYKLTLDDTHHIPLEEIEKERKDGLMSEDLIQQEYYTSFTMGVEGSFYAKYIDHMRRENRISYVPWDNSHVVHTAWDLGVNDSTCILFFQYIGQKINIIDAYDNNKQGLEHYAHIVKSKPYIYGKHIAPHDIQVIDFGSGLTRIEKARQLGISFILSPRISVADGIETVRSKLQYIWINEHPCQKFIKAIENYRQEYDVKRKVYKSIPLHDWSSDYADALRYLCISLNKTTDSISPEELDKRYQETMYGNSYNLPEFFK